MSCIVSNSCNSAGGGSNNDICPAIDLDDSTYYDVMIKSIFGNSTDTNSNIAHVGMKMIWKFSNQIEKYTIKLVKIEDVQIKIGYDSSTYDRIIYSIDHSVMPYVTFFIHLFFRIIFPFFLIFALSLFAVDVVRVIKKILSPPDPKHYHRMALKQLKNLIPAIIESNDNEIKINPLATDRKIKRAIRLLEKSISLSKKSAEKLKSKRDHNSTSTTMDNNNSFSLPYLPSFLTLSTLYLYILHQPDKALSTLQLANEIDFFPSEHKNNKKERKQDMNIIDINNNNKKKKLLLDPLISDANLALKSNGKFQSMVYHRSNGTKLFAEYEYLKLK